jgi:anti-anti-sigma factor
MRIKETRKSDTWVLAPDGNLAGADDCAALDGKLESVTAQGARFIVLDLGEVGQIAGPALRTLVLTARKLRRKQGRLVLCRLSEPVQRIFALSGFDRHVALVGTVPEALRRVFESTVRLSRPPSVAPPASVVPEPDRASTLADLVLGVVGAGAPVPAAAPPTLPGGERAEPVPDGLAALVLALLSAS